MLESLAIPNRGDFIVFCLASRCLPVSCRTWFEAQVVDDYPTMDELFNFIRSRVSILERVQQLHEVKLSYQSRSSIQFHRGQKGLRMKAGTQPQSSMINMGPSTSNSNCKCCNKGNHALSSCYKFKEWSYDVRAKWVRERRLCFRCLGEGHWAPKCQSSTICSHCPRKHHSLVHQELPATSKVKENAFESENSGPSPSSSLVSHLDSHIMLLGTALV